MKLKQLKKGINEAIEGVANVDEKVYGTMGYVMADAINKSKKRKEEVKKVMEERKSVMPNQDRFAHTKVESTPELKKMHLSEDAFEMIDLRNRGSKSRKSLKEANEKNGTSDIAKFIKDSVDGLITGDATNYRYKLDDRLAIFVGWSEGYGDEERDDVIQDKNDLDWGINAGIKVWTSDDMWTDFDWINFPYYENDQVIDTSVSISENEDYDNLARYFVAEYNKMKDLDIAEDGRIIEDGNSIDESVGDEVKEFYEVRFDEDANNLNDTFEKKEDAIKYAKRNVKEGPVVYFIDSDGNEEEVWYADEEALEESLDASQTHPIDTTKSIAGRKPIKESREQYWIIETNKGIYKVNGKIALFDTEAEADTFIDDNNLSNAVVMFADEDDINGGYKMNESFLNETGEIDSRKCADILNNEIDWDIVDETGDVDFAVEQLRSLCTNDVITEDEYNFILDNWDDLLENKADTKNDKEELTEGVKFGQSSLEDVLKTIKEYYKDHSAEDAIDSIFELMALNNEDETYKLAYAVAERVEEFVGEELEDSQKYPIESPFEKKEGDGVKADQKYPIKPAGEKKDSQFVKAEQKAPVGLTESTKLEESVKIITELSEFEPWTESAIETWDKIRDNNKLDTLDFMLEDMYPEGIGETELNDLLRFDSEWVLDMVGLSDESEDEEEISKIYDGNANGIYTDDEEPVEEGVKSKSTKGSEYDIDVSQEEADAIAESLLNMMNNPSTTEE